MKCYYRNTIDSCACANLLSTHKKMRGLETFILYKGMGSINVANISNEELWFVGIPFTVNDYPYIDQLLRQQNKIIWYDNHQSSIQMQSNYIELNCLSGCIDPSCSCIVNLYKHLYHPLPCQDIPYYIKLIDLYESSGVIDDITQDPYAFIYGMMKERHSPLAPIWDTFINNFQTAHNVRMNGNIILDYIQKQENEVLDRMGYHTSYNNRRFRCINYDIHHNLINHQLYNEDRLVSWIFDGTYYHYTISSKNHLINLLNDFTDFYHVVGNNNHIYFTTTDQIF